MGTMVGVLPGLGPTASIALLLPITFSFEPTSAIIMLGGIYYGSMYGGSTTSILVNIPGETASIITCLDGHQMAKQGRAGPALGICAFGSFIAGTFSVFGLMCFAPLLAIWALKFGPTEYFSVMILGLTILIYLAVGSMIKALMMAALGVILSSVGVDTLTNLPRYTFGIPDLMEGVGVLPLVMGLFGVSEVLLNVERTMVGSLAETDTRLKNLLPNLKDWAESIWPIIRGTVLGFFLSIIPGTGPTVSTFVDYALEKKLSKHPEKFGTGTIVGVAGPESANNAATGGGLIPLFILGIPPNAVLAIMLGAFILHGIQPGPTMLETHADLFWGVVVSMYIGNIMLLVLNLPLIGIWVRVLRIPYVLLFPLILLLCLIGSYTLNNSIVDVYLMIFFGIIGYLFNKFRYEMAPLVLAFVLAPLMEDALRQALIISDGSLAVFFQKPISAVLLSVSTLLLLSPLFPKVRKGRGLQLGEE